MAKPVSAIESHPQRQRIIEAIAAGTPYRDITAWTNPPVTPMTLSRFKRSAVDTIIRSVTAAKSVIANNDENGPLVSSEAVTRAALQAAVDPFVSRILKHQATLDTEIATASGDGRTVAALVSTDLKGLELHARLTGRLDTAREATNIMIVCPATTPADAPVDDGAVVIDIRPGR